MSNKEKILNILLDNKGDYVSGEDIANSLQISRNAVWKSISKLKEEEEYLNMEVEKLKDPDYVARYAREQFLYSKDGEFNIRIK